MICMPFKPPGILLLQDAFKKVQIAPEDVKYYDGFHSLVTFALGKNSLAASCFIRGTLQLKHWAKGVTSSSPNSQYIITVSFPYLKKKWNLFTSHPFARKNLIELKIMG